MEDSTGAFDWAVVFVKAVWALPFRVDDMLRAAHPGLLY